jgi:hypothetical protein
MRAQSVYDRDGNSYRYCRAVHKVKEIEERRAQEQKWADLYEKVAVKGREDDKGSNVNR